MRFRGEARTALLVPIAVLLAAALLVVLRRPPRPAPRAGASDEEHAALRALETAEALRALPDGSPLLSVPPGAPSASYSGEAAPRRAPLDAAAPLLPEWTVELLRWEAGARRFVVVPGGETHEALRIVVRVRPAPKGASASPALGVRPVLSRLTVHRLAPYAGGSGP
ncbi:MAG: hypothetical protein EDX89_22790 [Acidobacteria bacterium]|nr:MAG: hypothetical protein EDX89_22790 [Acidobacteriota bacterium]